MADAADGAGADLGDGDGAGGDGSAAGAICTKPADCTAPADLCALLPGKAVGYCTVGDCDPQRDSSCPAGHVCRDLSSLSPGQPPLCILTCEPDRPECPAGFACRDLSVFVPGLPPICFPESGV